MGDSRAAELEPRIDPTAAAKVLRWEASQYGPAPTCCSAHKSKRAALVNAHEAGANAIERLDQVEGRAHALEIERKNLERRLAANDKMLWATKDLAVKNAAEREDALQRLDEVERVAREFFTARDQGFVFEAYHAAEERLRKLVGGT